MSVAFVFIRKLFVAIPRLPLTREVGFIRKNKTRRERKVIHNFLISLPQSHLRSTAPSSEGAKGLIPKLRTSSEGAKGFDKKLCNIIYKSAEVSPKLSLTAKSIYSQTPLKLRSTSKLQILKTFKSISSNSLVRIPSFLICSTV